VLHCVIIVLERAAKANSIKLPFAASVLQCREWSQLYDYMFYLTNGPLSLPHCTLGKSSRSSHRCSVVDMGVH